MPPPAAHFDYDDACQCSLCTGYRRTKVVYEAAKAERAKHHRCCRCTVCTGHRDALVDYLAAANRREVYSELSFTLAFPSQPHQLAGECQRWLYGRISDPGYRSLGWWALNGDRRAIRSWIDDFQTDWGAARSLPSNFWAVSGIC